MGRGRTDYKLARARIVAKVGARTFDVLRVLLDHARNGEALITATEIGDALHFSRVTAHKHLRRLEDAGVIAVGEWVTREDGSCCVSRRIDPRWVGGLQVGLHFQETQEHNVKETGCSISPRCRAGATGEMETMTLLDMIEDLNATAPRRVRVDLALMPPYPTPSVCPLVRYPSQPRLPENTAAAARMMVRSFKAVVLKAYGKSPRVDRKAEFRMKRVLAAFKRHGIDNAWAWSAYRMTHWQAHNDDGKAPPVDWILNAPAVDKFAGAFKATAARYEHIGKVSMTPAHRELMSRWQKLSEALCKINTADAQAVREKRDQILPDHTFNKLRDLSEHQRGAEEARLFAALARGRWIW